MTTVQECTVFCSSWAHDVSSDWEAGSMEKKQERPQNHEYREAQKLVTRIEKQAREADTKRTLDNYRKKVGS
jgi:hypothetical protein